MTSSSIRRENSPQVGLCFNCETQDRGLVGSSREEEKAMERQPLIICILVFLYYQDNAGIWDQVTNVSCQPWVGCGLGFHKWRGCRWRFLPSIGDIWYSTTQGGGPRSTFHAARAYEQEKIQVLAHLHRFGIIVVCITFHVIPCVAQPARQGLGLGYWSR